MDYLMRCIFGTVLGIVGGIIGAVQLVLVLGFVGRLPIPLDGQPTLSFLSLLPYFCPGFLIGFAAGVLLTAKGKEKP